MKKLLPSLFVLALMASACGASEEQKVEEQKANEEQVDQKVDEIMNQLEESAAEMEEVITDSNAMEAEGMEESHEGHDHGDDGHDGHDGHDH